MASPDSSPRKLRWRRLARAEQGAAAVEFAMSATVFFMVLIGLMKICLAIYTYHYVSEAAREGSRYAIVRGSACDTTFFPTACPATGDNIQNYVRGLNYPGITPSLLTVTTSWATYPAGKPCTPSLTCNNPSDIVSVTASYAFPLNIPGLGSRNYTMASTSVMVISQ